MTGVQSEVDIGATEASRLLLGSLIAYGLSVALRKKQVIGRYS